ncbi:T-complex protein 11-domain-containing protein [Terfezia claveryi]|nr:T-complex protein 11-domain-containing protein [Terfezia claveryi]
MAEGNQMCHNQIFHTPLQTGDTDYDASNATKPMDLSSETQSNPNRAPGSTFEGYQTPTTAGTARNSPKRKPQSTEVLAFRDRPKTKRARHEAEDCISQAQTTDAPKLTAVVDSRPAQSMTRTASTHKSSPLPSRVRPRAHSLPARLVRPDWPAHHSPDRHSQHVPPVNLKTLRELELSEFYRNPKLRHDVVFDSQLHFRPNNDGTRGMKKKVDSHGYWQLVLVEFEVLLNASKKKDSSAHTHEGPMKIPILLVTMRDILLTLVPRADREEVESSLDPDLLMQQLEHGILDLKRMSLWLARIFKAHCAPMRDQWVDLMVSQFARGVDKGDNRALMEGWKSIFGILEAMKLDVANHQIRTLRPHLISTAVVFEQSYFQSRIDQGRLDTQEARQWYHDYFLKYKKLGGANDHVDCFMQATLDMVTPSKDSTFPSTFVFDYERLECLRDDIREATCLRLCTLLFRQLALGVKRDIEDKDISKLMETISAVLGEEGGSEKYVQRSADVALSIAHIACGNTLPSASVIKVAENWLAKHLLIDSTIYKATELRIIKEIVGAMQQTVKSWCSPASFPISQVAEMTGNSVNVKSVAQRLANIAYLHWQVFGRLVYMPDPLMEQKWGSALPLAIRR